MPAPVLSDEALDIRQGAAWNEYQRDHVPGNTHNKMSPAPPPPPKSTEQRKEAQLIGFGEGARYVALLF
jgi:hypothetical protein